MTTISSWIAVADAAKAVAFYRDAFGATELERTEDGDGAVIVAHLAIDGADFWVQHEPGLDPRPVEGEAIRMILSVDDPDTVYGRAVAAGATAITPMYEGHGWRIGRIADPSGHHWEIGRPLG
jgi:PhnB protein